MPSKKGFTLIELLAVVLIVGILASVAVPSMQKTMEANRATEAIGTMMQIASAQKSCKLNNITSQKTSCPVAVLSSVHRLVVDKYIANQDWNKAIYGYGTGGSTSVNPLTVKQICYYTYAAEPIVAEVDACTGKKYNDHSGFTNNVYYSSNGECVKKVGKKDYCPKF